MYETANKILESAKDLSLPKDSFQQVSSEKWKNITKQIFDTFSDTSDTRVTWLWSNLKSQGVSLQTDNGLNHIESLFTYDTKVWVLFEDWDRTKKMVTIGYSRASLAQQ